MSANPLPYGQHLIEADDVDAVRSALHDNFIAPGLIEPAEAEAMLADLAALPLTQGPRILAFEQSLAAAVSAKHAVSCSSGTAALHLILAALDTDGRHACIVPSITFLATATAVRMCGAEVIFADVDPDTGLMGPREFAEAITRADRPVKAVLPVHMGGRVCDMTALARIAAEYDIAVIEDGCHALGAASPHGKVGDSAHSIASVFSFHPVKTIACGEGGAVTTNDPLLADRISRLRNHGVTREADLMSDLDLSLDSEGQMNPWSYEQLDLGFNYRMTEIEAALGSSQLGKLDRFMERRRELSDLYDQLLAPLQPHVRPVKRAGGESLHLYGLLIDFEALGISRAALMRGLSAKGVGTQVHYIPVYRQPYFTHRYGAQRHAGAEAYYARSLSLPLFPAMTDEDVKRVCAELAAQLMKAGT